MHIDVISHIYRSENDKKVAIDGLKNSILVLEFRFIGLTFFQNYEKIYFPSIKMNSKPLRPRKYHQSIVLITKNSFCINQKVVRYLDCAENKYKAK